MVKFRLFFCAVKSTFIIFFLNFWLMDGKFLSYLGRGGVYSVVAPKSQILALNRGVFSRGVVLGMNNTVCSNLSKGTS